MNDQYHFSIYGYLDASADTQWVRVMPVRENFFLDPDKPFDVTVTLEHMESGDTAVMNDSLFSYSHGVYAWNFWATKELHPDQTYRIVAEHSDGKSSYASVSLPPDFPTPMFLSNPPGTIPMDFITIEDVERLADAQVIFHLEFDNPEENRLLTIPHLQDSSRQVSGDYMIVIDPVEDQRIVDMFDSGTITRKQIFIASAGPDFQFFPNIDEKIVALPDGISNVIHGTGYLAGIVSKTLPYGCSTCEPEPPPW